MGRFLILLIILFISINCYSKEVFKVYKGKLVRIIDGDTIVVKINNNELKVRLLYIDAPEVIYLNGKYHGNPKFYKDLKRCNIQKDVLQLMGMLAVKNLIEYLNNRDDIFIKILNRKGKYKRYLGILYKYNEYCSYNLYAIERGYACVYKYSKRPKVFDLIENDSKKLRVGLWKRFYREMECLCRPK